MTTPTQPPDPRVERIAKALAANKLSLITSVALARVLVEELGGREATVREIETVAEPVQRVTWGYDGAITATHNGAVYVLTGPEGARFEHKNLDTLILNWPQAAPHRAALETLAAQAQPSGKAGELDTRARVLVEELGGREANVAATEIDPRIVGWMDVCIEIFKLFPTMHTDMRQIPVHSRQAAAIRQLAAQQRENAETIKTITERVETAEAANTELDNARKSAEQSARDLRDNNTTLRAELDAINTKTEHDQALMDTQAKLIVDLETELDAIKGAQRGVKFIAHNDVECTARFADGKYNITWQHGELGPMTLDAMYKTWSHLKAEERAALEALRHPAPALPVVGACVVRDTAIGPYVWDGWPQDVREEQARKDAKVNGGAAYRLYRDVTPLPTEGGK